MPWHRSQTNLAGINLVPEKLGEMYPARRHRRLIICTALFVTAWIVMLLTAGSGLKRPLGDLSLLDASFWRRKGPAGGRSSSADAGHPRRKSPSKSKPGAAGHVPWANKHLPTPVLVFAGMRTGSSLVGEILGNSKDVFYLFEPGHAVQTTLDPLRAVGLDYDVPSLCLNVLAKLYRCDFRDLDFYLSYLSRHDLAVLRHRTPRLYDACRASQSPNATRCNVTRRMATRACKKSKYVLVKEIRLSAVGMLTPLIEDHGLDLKVINLVRDPRPMTASHAMAMHGRDLHSGKTLPEYSKRLLSGYCRHGKANLELGRSPSWRRRYMFLRYEDMALDPTSATKKIFAFLGRVTVPSRVRRWILENTKSGTPGRYSTNGNASRVYQAWRSSMPYEVAKAIEETGECRDMMNMMGYGLLEDKRHQRNLSRSLY